MIADWPLAVALVLLTFFLVSFLTTYAIRDCCRARDDSMMEWRVALSSLVTHELKRAERDDIAPNVVALRPAVPPAYSLGAQNGAQNMALGLFNQYMNCQNALAATAHHETQ